MKIKWKRRRNKEGTTLVEMIVTLMLISIMMAMAAASLSSASRIFVRIQKAQYAQSILDTVMTEIRTLTKDATVYVKIYEDGENIAEKEGVTSGNALEFVNTEGYAVLISTDGCEKTELYIRENAAGVADPVEKGELLTRYYFRNSTDGTYVYEKEGQPIARAVAPVYGEGFYMKNYLKITYTLPENVDANDVKSVLAKVELYSDKECQNKVAEDSEVLEFRYKVKSNLGITAK